MDICTVLSGFNPLCPSEFELSSLAIRSGKLPEPSLFFTWYCEKAREVEKYTGSVEYALKLLDLALDNLPSNSRIAKRFIFATRHSLLQYNSYLNSLASKLEQESVPIEEKATVLETLRTIDLRTFEMRGSKSKNSEASNFGCETELETEYFFKEPFSSSDWAGELEILDHILDGRFESAFQIAQQNIFFPSALKEKYSSSSPIDWLILYCKSVAIECDNYLGTLKEKEPSISVISPDQCEDFWSEVVDSYLGSDERPFALEQTINLISTKCKMAEHFLKSQIKTCKDDEIYF